MRETNIEAEGVRLPSASADVEDVGDEEQGIAAPDGVILPRVGRACRHYRSDAADVCRGCVRERWAELSRSYAAFVRENRATYLAAAGVPERFALCGVDTFEQRTRDYERVLAELVAWAARIGAPGTADAQPRGLYLHGPVGTGKTHLAIAALLELLATLRTGRFVSVRELLLECRESFREPAERRLSEILDAALERDVLLLDDLGAEKATEFARADVLLALVDRAYSSRRPALVVTANLSLEQLGAKTDERIADRLRELCVVVRLGGPSYRRRLSTQRS